MRVFDVFNYNGEPIVDARVEYLHDSVDFFVIVEGLHTFTGKRKHDYLFSASVFPKDKVIFVPVPDVVQGGAWANEAYQRNAALGVLRTLMHDDDIAFCSDADELPNKHDFRVLAATADLLGGATLVRQDFYYYNFNWKQKTDWANAFLARGRVLRQHSIQTLRGRLAGGRKSGWHCSYAESADDIRRKIESFSHTEYDRAELKTDEHLQACLHNGRDLFNRPDADLVHVSATHLPPELQRFNTRIRQQQGFP